jgi:hypothetical protein
MPYRSEAIRSQDIPQVVSQSFNAACPDTEVVKMERFLGAESVDYYAFSFTKDGKLHQAYFRPDGQFAGVQDVTARNPIN